MFLRSVCSKYFVNRLPKVCTVYRCGVAQYGTVHESSTVVPCTLEAKVPATAVLQEVVQKLNSQGFTIMKTEYGEELMNLFMDDNEVDASLVAQAFIKNPVLLGMSPAKFRSKIDVLKDLGYNINHCIMIFSYCPPILNRPTEDIFELVETMRYIGFTTENIRAMVMKRPQVFAELTPEKLKHFSDNIQNMFSRKQAVYLITKHPQLCFEDFETFEKKFEYLYFNMGYENLDMVKSKRWVFKPLFYMRFRHECLVRTGNYVRPHRKKKQLSKDNPRIGQIFDTPPKIFAEQNYISLEELEVFERMYARQLDYKLDDPPTETHGDDTIIIDPDNLDDFDDEIVYKDYNEDVHERFGEQYFRQKGYYPVN